MNPWRHIKVTTLSWFCHQAPARLRWKLQIKPGGNKLEIVTPHGRLDFKLTGGAWIRKQDKI